MAIHDHYLIEDFERVSVHLDIIHKSLMNILEAGTSANFKLGEESKIQLEKSYQVLETLHKKKLERESHSDSEYIRRNFF